MSIRLRLTLLYSAILALALVLFGAMLYAIQAQTTLREYRDRLAGAGRFIAELEHRSAFPPPVPGFRPPRERFPGQPYWQLLDSEGNVLQADPNLEGVTLPLSDAGRQAVAGGQAWMEINRVGSERFLIYSLPVTTAAGTGGVAQIAVSLAERDRYLRGLARILTTGGAIAVLLAFGIGWVVAGFSLRPIHRITQTAQAIGAERDFSRRVEHHGPHDEIGQLATTFNDMLAQLQDAYLQVEQALQAQKRFAADASHELRTPLTTIRGNLGLLQREPPIRREEQQDVLNDMVEETERLMRLVDNLLALARADAGLSLHLEPVALDDLLNEVHRQSRLLAPRRTVTCRTENTLLAQADRDALKQVLLALLDNAIRHTTEAGKIDITAREAGKMVAIHVRDDGPGIPPEELPYIFDRFYRGDPARAGQGAGLGLAIARELTEAQGGTIHVESESGQGSVFTITLPAAKSPLPAG